MMDYENDVTEPEIPVFLKIASALEIEPDKLCDDYFRFLLYPYSQKVKEIRTDKKMTQAQLGARLGVGRRAVERWEKGGNKVTRSMWEQIKKLRLL